MYTKRKGDSITIFHLKTLVKADGRKWNTDNGNQPEWYDKAGGYAIQGRFARYIRDIAGDFYNVMGLPVSVIIQRLANMGVNL